MPTSVSRAPFICYINSKFSLLERQLLATFHSMKEKFSGKRVLLASLIHVSREGGGHNEGLTLSGITESTLSVDHLSRLRKARDRWVRMIKEELLPP